ncbi:MAG: helix-turn-helix domain-containing protein [Candidatus Binatia bacterium]
MEPLLTVNEAARLLNVKASTLYAWAYRRQIPSQKVGKVLRFRRQDLESWLDLQVKPCCARTYETEEKGRVKHG